MSTTPLGIRYPGDPSTAPATDLHLYFEHLAEDVDDLITENARGDGGEVTGPGIQTDCGSSFVDLASLAVAGTTGQIIRLVFYGAGTQITGGSATTRLRATSSDGKIRYLDYRNGPNAGDGLAGTAVMRYVFTANTTITFKIQGTAASNALRVGAGVCSIWLEGKQAA